MKAHVYEFSHLLLLQAHPRGNSKVSISNKKIFCIILQTTYAVTAAAMPFYEYLAWTLLLSLQFLSSIERFTMQSFCTKCSETSDVELVKIYFDFRLIIRKKTYIRPGLKYLPLKYAAWVVTWIFSGANVNENVTKLKYSPPKEGTVVGTSFLKSILLQRPYQPLTYRHSKKLLVSINLHRHLSLSLSYTYTHYLSLFLCLTNKYTHILECIQQSVKQRRERGGLCQERCQSQKHPITWSQFSSFICERKITSS